MAEIGTVVAILVGLGNILAHLMNMRDRAQQEGVRNERISRLMMFMDDAQSMLRSLESKVVLLTQRIDLQEEELKGIRADMREGK